MEVADRRLRTTVKGSRRRGEKVVVLKIWGSLDEFGLFPDALRKRLNHNTILKKYIFTIYNILLIIDFF